MRIFLASVILSLMSFTIIAGAQGKADPVRELKVKFPEREPKGGGPNNATVIKNSGDLIKAVKDETAILAISKQVDFNKEQVLLFSWGGSGGDKLTFNSYDAKANEAVFHYKGGLTFDLRPHNHLYVLPKGATWKIQQVKMK